MQIHGAHAYVWQNSYFLGYLKTVGDVSSALMRHVQNYANANGIFGSFSEHLPHSVPLLI